MIRSTGRVHLFVGFGSWHHFDVGRYETIYPAHCPFSACRSMKKRVSHPSCYVTSSLSHVVQDVYFFNDDMLVYIIHACQMSLLACVWVWSKKSTTEEKYVKSERQAYPNQPTNQPGTLFCMSCCYVEASRYKKVRKQKTMLGKKRDNQKTLQLVLSNDDSTSIS